VEPTALKSNRWDGIIISEEKLRVSVQGRCSAKRCYLAAPDQGRGDVPRDGSEDECENEMFVTIRRKRDGLAVPLSQLTAHPKIHGRTRLEDMALLGADGVRVRMRNWRDSPQITSEEPL